MTIKLSRQAIEHLDVSTDKNNVAHLNQMVKVFALDALLNIAQPLSVQGHLKPHHFRSIEDAFSTSIAAMRPQALNMIESF